MIGAPVPDNLDSMTIPQLHALHVVHDEENAQIREKRMIVKAVLDAKYQARDAANRAAFDQHMGGK